MSDRVETIRSILTRDFNPRELEVIDDSHRHAGHAGAAEHGGGHYRVRIRAAAFAGKSSVERHRMVYAALGELMRRDIHALSIDAGE